MNAIEKLSKAEAWLAEAKERFAKNPTLCFHCLERLADNLVAIVTDQEIYRGSADCPRMVIVGICVVCELLTDSEDLHLASQRVLSD